MRQTIEGIVDLKMHNKEVSYINQYLSNSKKLISAHKKSYFLSLLPAKIMEIVSILGLFLLSLSAALFDLQEDFIVFIGVFAVASYRMIPSTTRILWALNSIKRSHASVKETSHLENFEDVLLEKSTSIKPIEFQDSIEMKNISFAYETKKIIQDISLTIKKGEKIGIIGESGSGKTTLMNIILRLITENQGHIYIDKVPLTDDQIKSWHQSIGYVKQNVYIFDTTIKGNVALGEKDEDIDDIKVWDALKKASLDTYVQAHPHGLNAKVGEQGLNLSGGQCQRIGIARAFYKNPGILFLDEATSSLDNETEEEITKEIEKLMCLNATIIIIAHRYTTLRFCNRIIELKDGKISGTYSYSEIASRYI